MSLSRDTSPCVIKNRWNDVIDAVCTYFIAKDTQPYDTWVRHKIGDVLSYM